MKKHCLWIVALIMVALVGGAMVDAALFHLRVRASAYWLTHHTAVVTPGWATRVADGTIRFSPFRAFFPVLAAQNAAYKQTLTFTSAAAVRPYLCGDTGTCPGTPAWKTDGAVDGAQLTLETNPIRYWYDGSVPTASVGHLTTAPFTIVLQQRSNVINFQGIATGSNAAGFMTIVRN